MTLLTLTRRGDQAAAAALHARFVPRLTALARARLRGDEAGADDAVQTAFMQVLGASEGTIRRVRDVPAYLCRVVCNAASNHSRGELRRRVRQAAARVAPAGEPERADPIAEAVEMLPPEQRDVVLLRHLGGLSFDQAALCLDAPRGTVASRYRLALASLRRVLAAPGPDASPFVADRETTHAR